MKKIMMFAVGLFVVGIFLNTAVFAVGPNLNETLKAPSRKILPATEKERVLQRLEDMKVPIENQIEALKQIKEQHQTEIAKVQEKLANFEKVEKRRGSPNENPFIALDRFFSKMRISQLEKAILLCNEVLKELDRKQLQALNKSIKDNGKETISKYKNS